MQSVLDFILHNERFASWFFKALPGLIIWLLGSVQVISPERAKIAIPGIIATVLRIPTVDVEGKKRTDPGIMLLQILGLVMFTLSFYSLFSASEDMALSVYVRGTILFFVFTGLLYLSYALLGRLKR